MTSKTVENKIDNRFKPCSEEKKENIRKAKLSVKNYNWKEDGKITDRALHIYVKRRVRPKTNFCEFCQLVTKTELANITRIYNRQKENWRWLCHKCHVNFDYRFKKKEIENRTCLLCNTRKTFRDRKGCYHWFNYQRGHICRNCYKKMIRRLRYQFLT